MGGETGKPSKTHYFLPTCKCYYGNIGKFSWFCYFFSLIFLDFFKRLGFGGCATLRTASSPSPLYVSDSACQFGIVSHTWMGDIKSVMIRDIKLTAKSCSLSMLYIFRKAYYCSNAIHHKLHPIRPNFCSGVTWKCISISVTFSCSCVYPLILRTTQRQGFPVK